MSKVTPPFFTVEHRVNGFWNSIFHLSFPTRVEPPITTNNFAATFLIAPEAYPKNDDTHGQMCDLLVSRMTSDATNGYSVKPCVAFEGKGKGGNTLPGARKQLEDWFQGSKLKGNDFCYAVTAVDNHCLFYVWRPKTSDKFLVPIVVNDKGEVKEMPITGDHTGWDIINDWNGVISIIFQYMQHNLPA
jgi:hypothetical protein